MPLGHFDVMSPVLGSLSFPRLTVTTTNTAGALTLTTAQVLGGLILRDCNGGARTDTLPTAAALVGAIQGAQVGTSFRVTIRNTTSTAVAITIAAGAGITLSGTATIAQLNSKSFLFVITNVTPGSEAITAYSEGTLVF